MNPKGVSNGKGGGFWPMFLLLAVVILVFFGNSLLPGHTLFSNDAPLGRVMSQCHHLPEAFTGVWEDLNYVGIRELGALPDVTYGLRYLLKPILFSKLYVPVALLILGFGAWSFFRASGLSAPASVLGGLAAALNVEFFSTGCWGIASQTITTGMGFFALAALLQTGTSRTWRIWLYVALAGLAVGMGLTEGADVGAIFSIYVAAFVIYQAWIQEGSRFKNLAVGTGRLLLVAVFAAFLAAQALSVLINTQIEGVTGMKQDQTTREKRWNWATEWSLPKRETLSLFVPGLFGYRTDTPGEANYWGAIGRDTAWDDYFAKGQEGKKPAKILRQTGGGIYAGISVILVALWAAAQSLRGKDSVFNIGQRRWLWFWGLVVMVSLLLSFGRYAPFYKLVYRLPYFSTIRNPIKFVKLVNFALVILFGYGVDALWRNYLTVKKSGNQRAAERHSQFDKYWIRGTFAALAACLIGWLAYNGSMNPLVEYMQSVMYSEAKARAMARFSIHQAGIFVLLLGLAVIVVSLILKGTFSGDRARWGLVLLGLVLALDLGLADEPWVVTWDYQRKYETNPLIDLLRQKPYEHRVAIAPFNLAANHQMLNTMYRYEWAQQQFQYYDIQSFDIVQMPRVPDDISAYQKATFFDGTDATTRLVTRRWELTNTRYLFGDVGELDSLNSRFDPVRRRFQIAERFNFVKRPGVNLVKGPSDLTAQPNPQGEYALIEFTGALPRAALFSRWEVNTNYQAALDEIVSPAFDPHDKVLVAQEIPPSQPATNTNASGGSVEFASYHPKDIVLNASVLTPSVLLLNDRFDPGWSARVDGKPAPLLRCNYIMRGVYLEPGTHTVEFQFQPPARGLYVSLAALTVGLALMGLLVATKPPARSTESAKIPGPTTEQPVVQPKPAAPVPAKKKSRNSKAKI